MFEMIMFIPVDKISSASLFHFIKFSISNPSEKRSINVGSFAWKIDKIFFFKEKMILIFYLNILLTPLEHE